MALSIAALKAVVLAIGSSLPTILPGRGRVSNHAGRDLNGAYVPVAARVLRLPVDYNRLFRSDGVPQPLRHHVMTYDSLSDVLNAFDRNVSSLLGRENVEFFVGLPRLLDFIRRDARLAQAASELTDLTVRREHDYQNAEDEILRSVREHWAKHSDIYSAAADAATAKGNREIFDARVRFADFGERLDRPSSFAFSEHDEIGRDDTQSGDLLWTLAHWQGWCKELPGAPEQLNPATSAFEELRDRQVHLYRSAWFDSRNLAGVALRRLKYVAHWLNPDPADDSRIPMDAGITRWVTRPIVDLIFGSAGGFGSSDGSGGERWRLDSEATRARRDLALLHQDIKDSLLLKRSNLGLLKQFQARCERFDAPELRDVSSQTQHEASLTRRLARFLFDQGLDPLVDPTIAELRPDVFVPRTESPVYVESKQYSADGDPRDVVRKALRQVLDTWGRLRSTYPVDEAFLAIFRRGGPRVEIRDVLRIHGRTLYTVLIDIAEPSQSGSRQKVDPVTIDDAEVVEIAAGVDETRQS